MGQWVTITQAAERARRENVKLNRLLCRLISEGLDTDQGGALELHQPSSTKKGVINATAKCFTSTEYPNNS